MSKRGTLLFRDYREAFEQHYAGTQRNPAIQLILDNVDAIANAGNAPNRFQRLAERPAWTARHGWQANGVAGHLAYRVALSYKGLINMKSSLDLQLYSSLLWELQPATIIEFGSLQGGSALWFADRLDTLCGGTGEVHSFELCVKCVHPSAAHPRLRFHYADLSDLENPSLAAPFLETLKHPWLVVDDAHINVLPLLRHMTSFMTAGDYYVLEDHFLGAEANLGRLEETSQLLDELGYAVDSAYTDAFGVNVTCAPNGWLKKT